MGRLYLKRKEFPGFLHHMREERMFVSFVLGRLSSLAPYARGENSDDTTSFPLFVVSSTLWTSPVLR